MSEIRPDGPGKPLPGPISGWLSDYFDADLSEVRLHHQPDALSQTGARAAAFANHVMVRFPVGPTPTAEEMGVLGHEVAHVIQHQRGQLTGSAFSGRGGGVTRFERDAERHQARIRTRYREQRSVGRIELDWGEFGDDPVRRQRIAHALEASLEARLPELLPGKLHRIDHLVVDGTVDPEASDDAIVAALTDQICALARRRAGDSAAPSEGLAPAQGPVLYESPQDRSKATRLATLIRDELDAWLNIDEGWIIKLLTGGSYRGESWTPEQISLALLELQSLEREVEQTNTYTQTRRGARVTGRRRGFKQTYLDFLFDQMADEGEDEWAALMDHLLAVEGAEALFQQTNVLDSGRDVVAEATAALNANRADFLRKFEVAARYVLLMLVTRVEQQTIQAIYEYTQLGVERGNMTQGDQAQVIDHFQETLRGQSIADKLREIEAQRKHVESVNDLADSMDPTIMMASNSQGMIYMTESGRKMMADMRAEWQRAQDQGYRDAQQAKLVELETAYQDLVAIHPVLLMQGMDAETVEGFAGSGRTETQRALKQRLYKVLSDSRESKRMILDDKVNIWLLDRVLPLAMQVVGVTPGTEQAKWVEDKARAEAVGNLVESILLAVVEIGLGIVAIFAVPFTGGASLAAWAVLAAGIGVGAYSAYRSTAAYSQKDALSNATMNRYEAVLDRGELSAEQKWLWIEWASVLGFGVMDAISMAKALKLAKAVKLVTEGSQPLAKVAGELNVAPELLEAATHKHIAQVLKEGKPLDPGLAKLRLEKHGFELRRLRKLTSGHQAALAQRADDELALLAEIFQRSPRNQVDSTAVVDFLLGDLDELFRVAKQNPDVKDLRVLANLVRDAAPSTGTVSREGLLRAATAPGKGQEFTEAGRALVKHSDRNVSAFELPRPAGGAKSTPEFKNAEGLRVVREILEDPNAVVQRSSRSRYAQHGEDVLDVRLPDGRGVRFSGDGKRLIGFLEPDYVRTQLRGLQLETMRKFEADLLQSSARLQELSPAELKAVSLQVVENAEQALKHEDVVFTVERVLVRDVDGNEIWALKLLDGPDRFGELIRRVRHMPGESPDFIYNPVQLLREGGSGFYDEAANTLHLDFTSLNNASSGILTAPVHELRHSITAGKVARGEASGYHGKFFFDKNAEPGSVPSLYRDQFQVDEIYTHQKQAVEEAIEFRRAIDRVRQLGHEEAFKDPKTKLFYTQGNTIARNNSLRARGFARAVRDQTESYLKHMDEGLAGVKLEPNEMENGVGPFYVFNNAEGQQIGQIEYWRTEDGRLQAAINFSKLKSGAPLEEADQALIIDLVGKDPGSFTPDAGHTALREALELMHETAEAAVKKGVDFEMNRVAQLEDLRNVVEGELRGQPLGTRTPLSGTPIGAPASPATGAEAATKTLAYGQTGPVKGGALTTSGVSALRFVDGSTYRVGEYLGEGGNTVVYATRYGNQDAALRLVNDTQDPAAIEAAEQFVEGMSGLRARGVPTIEVYASGYRQARGKRIYEYVVTERLPDDVLANHKLGDYFAELQAMTPAAREQARQTAKYKAFMDFVQKTSGLKKIGDFSPDHIVFHNGQWRVYDTTANHVAHVPGEGAYNPRKTMWAKLYDVKAAARGEAGATDLIDPETIQDINRVVSEARAPRPSASSTPSTQSLSLFGKSSGAGGAAPLSLGEHAVGARRGGWFKGQTNAQIDAIDTQFREFFGRDVSHDELQAIFKGPPGTNMGVELKRLNLVSKDKLVLSGLVKADGRQVGTIQRELVRESSGAYVLKNVDIQLDPAAGGKGYSKALYDQSDAFLRSLSNHPETRMELHADLAAGPYVWAKQDFQFRDQRVRQQFQKQWREYLDEQGVKLSDEELEAFQEPGDFARFDNGKRVKHEVYLCKGCGKPMPMTRSGKVGCRWGCNTMEKGVPDTPFAPTYLKPAQVMEVPLGKAFMLTNGHWHGVRYAHRPGASGVWQAPGDAVEARSYVLFGKTISLEKKTLEVAVGDKLSRRWNDRIGQLYSQTREEMGRLTDAERELARQRDLAVADQVWELKPKLPAQKGSRKALRPARKQALDELATMRREASSGEDFLGRLDARIDELETIHNAKLSSSVRGTDLPGTGQRALEKTPERDVALFLRDHRNRSYRESYQTVLREQAEFRSLDEQQRLAQKVLSQTSAPSTQMELPAGVAPLGPLDAKLLKIAKGPTAKRAQDMAQAYVDEARNNLFLDNPTIGYSRLEEAVLRLKSSSDPAHAQASVILSRYLEVQKKAWARKLIDDVIVQTPRREPSWSMSDDVVYAVRDPEADLIPDNKPILKAWEKTKDWVTRSKTTEPPVPEQRAIRKKVDQAWERIRQVVAPEILDELPPVRIVVHRNPLFRAYHSGSEIHVSAHESVDVIMHEFGHHLEEYGNLDHWLRIQKLLYSRSRQDRLRRIWMTGPNELRHDAAFPAMGLSESYTARYYDFGSTEVLSMGLQFMANPKNAAKLYVKDPEMFFIVLNAMRGPGY